MEITERKSAGRGWRISTPSFPGEETMDDFYAEAHAILEDYFRRVREANGRAFCVADHAVREEGAVTEVTLRMRLRVDGRYVEERRVTHRWRGGVL